MLCKDRKASMRPSGTSGLFSGRESSPFVESEKFYYFKKEHEEVYVILKRNSWRNV